MSKRYSQEFKDRAVRLLSDRLAADRSCSQWRAVKEIAPKLGVANKSLRRCYEQHLVNTGERQGMTREGHRHSSLTRSPGRLWAGQPDRP